MCKKYLLFLLVFLLSFSGTALSDELMKKGIALYKEKDYKSAIKYLKKVKDVNNLPQSQYYIGLCQTQLKKYNEAAKAFKEVIRSAPGQDMGKKSGQILSWLKRNMHLSERKEKKPWYLKLNWGLGWDSNLLSVGKDVTLPSDVSSKSDLRNAFSISAGVRAYDGEKAKVWLDYLGSLTLENDLTNYDTNINALALKWLYTLTEKITASILGSYKYTVVGSDTYSQIANLSSAISYKQRSWSKTNFVYSYQNSNYFYDFTNPAFDRDGHTNGLALTQEIIVPDTELSVRGGVEQSWTSAKGDDYDYRSFGISLHLWHPFFFESKINGGFKYLFNDYANLNSQSTTSQERYDKQLRLSVGFSKELTPFITGFVSYTLIDNDSNIGTFEYTRDVYVFGFSYNF